MKKTLLALSVAVAMTTVSAASFAAVEGTFDVGARGGWAFTTFDDNQYVTDDDDNGYGVGINFGYNVTDWFGVELGYNYFDGFAVKAKNAANNYDADFDFQGPELAVRFAYPLDEKGSDIYLRAGAMYVIADNDAMSAYETKLSPLAGVGVKYNFTKNFSARIGYDHYFDVYDSDSRYYSGNDSDIGFLYAGVNFTFGIAEPAPAPAPAAEPEHISQTFALEAGALFPFDGSNLTEEGTKTVQGVVAEVNSNNVTNATYTVTGYTDRIGAEAYNQKLSEKRAQAVADGLVASGVPADSIVSVQGLGESNPTTGTACDGKTGADLKQCLAPDRRVEIQVEGDVVTATVTEPAAE